MRLTTRGRFAVTAMIDMALHQQAGPVNLASISRRQQVSLSHLEQLFGKLRRHGLAASTRGPGGGYSLGRKAADISVADILFAIDDAAAGEAAKKSQAAAPGHPSRYATDELWASVNRCAVEFLDAITLQSLVDEQIARGVQPESGRAERRAPASSARAKPLLPDAPNSVFALGRMLGTKRS
ncbi:Rrf2 family transcriptional regulator [Variovorax paradoxus]|nr:Rrf2 family transcriptional regulator [Variovorax paradoxus]MBT2302228.1 Rrf2 family transcriptional regulator [Variovorax paradoxus]